MNWLTLRTNRIFDTLEHRWENPRGQRLLANGLILVFISGFIVIEFNRQRFLPPWLAAYIPTNHFYAVDFTFNFLLLMELAGLIFGLAHSVANSVGKQIEILSLILLRETFKEFTNFDEPIAWEQVQPVLPSIILDALGALLVFVLIGFYYRAQRHRPITDNAQGRAGFIAAKKLIALGLLITFFVLGIYSLQQQFIVGRNVSFFNNCYTALIFADVLLIFVSLRYSYTYLIVFRNSGFAIATVLIRLALIAPPPFNALLGVSSAAFALGLTLAYNRFAPELISGAPTTEGKSSQTSPLTNSADATTDAVQETPVPIDSTKVHEASNREEGKPQGKS
jgi:hypothetical protein